MAASKSPGDGPSDPRREVADAILDGRLTRQEAARELGVSTEAVRRWVAREQRARFVAVDVRDDAASPVAAVEVVVVGGRVLRVPAGVESATLVRLVRALESC